MAGIFSGIIDEKMLKVIRLFLDNPEEFYHINRVSSDSKVPLSTAFRIIRKLHAEGIIECRHISKMKIYCLSDCSRTKELGKVLR